MSFIPGPDTAPALIAPARLLEMYGARFDVGHFEIIRALPDHTVFVGLDEDGQRRWTFKVGLPGMRARHQRQRAFARQIVALQSGGQMTQMRVMTDGWRRWRQDGLFFLAHPYDPRPALGPERILLAVERRALVAEMPQMLMVITAFDTAGDRDDATDRFAPVYRAQIAKNIAELQEARIVCASLADDLLALASRLSLQVPVRPVHGDLTPWHVLTDVERPGLIDFEFAGLEGARFDDLSRLVQKIWTCQRAESLARRLLPAGLARLGVSEEGYWRDAALMALDRTVEGLSESIAWHADRDSARRHAAWNLRNLGQHRVLSRRRAGALAKHLLHGCDACLDPLAGPDMT